jgi:DNA-binding FadR family transcriptional regulator
LRKKTEAAYWHQAVVGLTPADHEKLQDLLAAAEQKLAGHPIEIPHQEHCALHLTIFSRLDNPFVLGLLEAYWDAYEEVGLNLYEELDYHRRVWQYHRRIVDCIVRGDFDAGHTALIEHMELISGRPEKQGSGTNAKEKYN